MSAGDRERSVRKGFMYWPARRTLFLAKGSFWSAFWVAVVVVAVCAAVVLALNPWEEP
jgi:hypothetical protein